MRRVLAIGMGVLVLACAIEARGAVPSGEEMERDLGTIYAASAARPEVGRRGELCGRIEGYLKKQGRYLASITRPWEKDGAACLVTDGKHIEAGIRPNTHTVFTMAVLAKCVGGDFPEGFSREAAQEKGIGLLKFVVATHGAGGEVCSDGLQWNSQWQSAHWAAQAGRGAWLLWDDLDTKTKWLAARMICDEADRFVDRPLDHGVELDTKAEENAWNSEVVALAYNMFPKHPRHRVWGETAIKWQLSAFVRAADLKSDPVVDGKKLSERVAFPNIYDDYTLENHGFVHPDYMTTITLNLYQQLIYDWGGNRAPEAIRFNAEKVYRSLKTFYLPDGGYVYPNGQDWSLHRVGDWLNAHVAMAVMFDDADAAAQARHCLESLEKLSARQPNGGMYLPDENRFPSGEEIGPEWAAQAYLLMAKYGEGPAPTEDRALWKKLAGRHVFEAGKFGVLRTENSVATFSWGARTMGQVFPLKKDLLITPNTHGLIGTVPWTAKKEEAAKVKSWRVSDVPGALAVTGMLERGNGMMTQEVAFVALPDGRGVYADVAKMTGGKKPEGVRQGTIGVANDVDWVYHDGKRRLIFADGEKVISGKDAAGPMTWSSPWYNLDGMGILVLGSSGKQTYDPKPTGAHGRLEQIFTLNDPGDADDLKPTVLVFYPVQKPEETRAASGKVKLTTESDGVFRISLEDGAVVRMDLGKLEIAVTK